MGERIEFPSNSHTCSAYFAGSGPAVVVIQEWWGLVPHIEDVVERFAREGFSAIAPDLYHGKTTKSPDEAGKLLMELDIDRAEREIAGAGQWLLKRPECTSKTYGVVGFCMGGALAQYTATKEADVSATVSFYGGFKKVKPQWENLHGPILQVYGENDQSLPREYRDELESRLKQLGKDVEVVVYPGAGHAFFNDARKDVHKPDAAADAWRRTIDLFRKSVR